MADREQQLVLARSEYQHVLSSHEHTKQQFDGEGGGGGVGESCEMYLELIQLQEVYTVW